MAGVYCFFCNLNNKECVAIGLLGGEGPPTESDATRSKDRRSLKVKKLAMICAVASLVIASQAHGALLFDRGLPTANLNSAAGANRSNVTWGGTGPTRFIGDDFMIGTIGQSYVIESLTVWGAQYDPLSDDIDNIWLYMGKTGDSLVLLSTGSVSGNTNSNPNITHSYVNYPTTAISLYEGNENSYPISQTTFSGLNYAVDGGVKYNFGVDGDKYRWWTHASNAALSVSPQDGADGLFLEFDTTDLSSVVVHDSLPDSWDKSSDINVQIYGVPEPGTVTLLTLGGLTAIGMTWIRRRRGR